MQLLTATRRILISTVGAAAVIGGTIGLVTSATASPAPVGVVAAVDPDKNHPDYWEAIFEAQGYAGVQCVKDDELDSKSYLLSDPPEGSIWVALILKAGSGDEASQVEMLPAPGTYTHDSGKDLSHVIKCWAPEAPPTTTPPTTPPTSPPGTTPPDTTPPGTTPPGTTPPGTGPVVETDRPASGNLFGTGAGLAAIAGGLALIVLSMRRTAREH